VATSSDARRKQVTKVEASLERSLRSPLERGSMQRRVMHLASEDPTEMVTILLKFYDHENPKTAGEVRSLLEKITSDPRAMRVVLDDITHSNPSVRKNAVIFLRQKKGFHAATYASFLENTSLLITMAHNKDIPVQDIEALLEVSKDSYLNGEMMEALQDIAACLDFIKHRQRTSEALRGYVTQMLKMAPDLTRIGAYDERLGEPLRKAIQASKNREVDETKDIISVRTQESTIRSDLNRIGKAIRSSTDDKPSIDHSQMAGADVWAMSRLKGFIETITSLAIAGKREEGLKLLGDYLEDDYPEFHEAAKERIGSKDQSALFTEYNIGLVALKLASYLMPQTAEDIYQRYFRNFEPEPSIHIVRWPDVALKVIA